MRVTLLYDEALQRDEKTLILVERSPFDCEHVFVKGNQDCYLPEELTYFGFLYQRMVCCEPWKSVAKRVFLYTPSVTCMDRARERDRAAGT